ncbi:uncharacterized protein VTP21DRAFT_3131 [Calcarisporiella thermophila]|uniref:uncharacterized protein n=1 Tax=Calcarisporiella thermophila TaxID=911321 RepID=UPI003742917E
MQEPDKILIRNLKVRTILGVDSWERVKKQPVHLDLTLHHPISQVGATDHLGTSLHYGLTTKAVTKFAEDSHFRSVEALAEGIAKVCISCGAEKAIVRVEKPRALLHAAAAGIEISRLRDGEEVKLDGQDTIFVRDLRLSTVIGVNPWEREETQVVIINLQIFPTSLNVHREDRVPKMYNYRTIVRTITRHVEASSYKTVEALVTSVARVAIEQCHVPRITVRAEKPSALLFADTAGVEVTRDRAWLNEIRQSERRASIDSAKSLPGRARLPDMSDGYNHSAYIALGTNIGSLAQNLYKALEELENTCECRVVDTSFLYKTPPMYVTDQPPFLNAVCQVMTRLAPEDLLARMKQVEENMGRVKTVRYGPRPIDLDILFYDDVEHHSETLQIPHPRIQDREFVLRPLCDIAKNLEHPKLFRTCGQLLSQLLKAQSDSPSQTMPISRVMPLGNNLLWEWGRQTYIMGILNVTPDSFSDGGSYSTVDAAVQYAEQLVADGADILDIGGMSTRPDAEDVPEEVEEQRVVPVIRKLRERGVKVPISVDTFRARVARSAIEAGANLVNDVHAGHADPDMLPTVAKLQVPICLMHTRGTARTMMSLTQYDDVIVDVREHLAKRVQSAIRSGIARWNIIVDPGIGFAKGAEHNFEVLRRLPELIASPRSPLVGFPCLVGPSKKAFIGRATDQPDPKKRGWGTAAAVTAAVAGGSDILRVHDVREMVDVVRVADGVWRKMIQHA